MEQSDYSSLISATCLKSSAGARKWEGMRYDGPAYNVTGVCIYGAPVGQ